MEILATVIAIVALYLIHEGIPPALLVSIAIIYGTSIVAYNVREGVKKIIKKL